MFPAFIRSKCVLDNQHVIIQHFPYSTSFNAHMLSDMIKTGCDRAEDADYVILCLCREHQSRGGVQDRLSADGFRGRFLANAGEQRDVTVQPRHRR